MPQWLLGLMGIGEFLPDSLFIDCLASLFCHEGELTQGLCTNILFIICGFDEAQVAYKQKYPHLGRCKYSIMFAAEQDPVA